MEVGRVHPFRPSSPSLHPDLDLGRGERREGGVWQNISLVFPLLPSSASSQTRFISCNEEGREGE